MKLDFPCYKGMGIGNLVIVLSTNFHREKEREREGEKIKLEVIICSPQQDQG
jgi:hypothetical protein